MKPEVTDDYVSALVDLGAFLFDFAKINRSTHLDKQGTPESDSDHTVMLSVIACAVAAKLHPTYDIGKIAQYALIHDLVEVYAGDVITINYYSVNKKAKSDAEKLALEKIKERFSGNFDWIHKTIEAYESLADDESRFVKALDKVMPAISQHLSGSMVINEKFDDPESFEASMRAITDDMKSSYAHDQHVAIALREKALASLIEEKYTLHGKKRRP